MKEWPRSTWATPSTSQTLAAAGRCHLCSAEWEHLRRLRTGELVCIDVRRCERRQMKQEPLFPMSREPR